MVIILNRIKAQGELLGMQSKYIGISISRYIYRLSVETKEIIFYCTNRALENRRVICEYSKRKNCDYNCASLDA